MKTVVSSNIANSNDFDYDDDGIVPSSSLSLQGVVVDPTTITTKRVLFVGGLADDVTVPLLRAAMIPFGPIRSVDIPMDYVKGKHRGFAFVEYDDPEDAEEAIYNMDYGELLGRTIQVSLAQANQIHKLTAAGPSVSTEAIWKSDEWFQQYAGGNSDNNNDASNQEQALKQTDAAILKGEKH